MFFKNAEANSDYNCEAEQNCDPARLTKVVLIIRNLFLPRLD